MSYRLEKEKKGAITIYQYDILGVINRKACVGKE